MGPNDNEEETAPEGTEPDGEAQPQQEPGEFEGYEEGEEDLT